MHGPKQYKIGAAWLDALIDQISNIVIVLVHVETKITFTKIEVEQHNPNVRIVLQILNIVRIEH